MAVKPWRYGRSETEILQSLHKRISESFPTTRHCWPFAPDVGSRFNEGPRLVFYGKATAGRWGNGKPVPAKLTPTMLKSEADDCVRDGPRISRFWRFLDRATEVVLNALGCPSGDDWFDRFPFIAWSNYLKIGEDAVKPPGEKLYRAQKDAAEGLMMRELKHWRPGVVISVVNLSYEPTTHALFGEDALWPSDRRYGDLWARDAEVRAGYKTRVFWSPHPQPLSAARERWILKAIRTDLERHDLERPLVGTAG